MHFKLDDFRIREIKELVANRPKADIADRSLETGRG